jgi:hypothetical protein
MEKIIIIKHLVVKPTQVLWYISNILEKIVEYMIHLCNIQNVAKLSNIQKCIAILRMFTYGIVGCLHYYICQIMNGTQL